MQATLVQYIMCKSCQSSFLLPQRRKSDAITGDLKITIIIETVVTSVMRVCVCVCLQILKEDDNLWPSPDRVGRQVSYAAAVLSIECSPR